MSCADTKYKCGVGVGDGSCMWECGYPLAVLYASLLT